MSKYLRFWGIEETVRGSESSMYVFCREVGGVEFWLCGMDRVGLEEGVLRKLW